MSNLTERYMLAVQTPNMRVDPDHQNSMDCIIASGMTKNRPGLIFMRARSEFDGSCGKVSASSLESAFLVLDSELFYLTNEPTGRIAQKVFAWWLGPTCPTCNGHGTVVSLEYPTGKVCLDCRGTRMRKLPYGEVGRALVSFIESSIAESSDQINRVLRRK